LKWLGAGWEFAGCWLGLVAWLVQQQLQPSQFFPAEQAGHVRFDQLDELYALVYSKYLFETVLVWHQIRILSCPIFTQLYVYYLILF
jgi:hypothetical protein